MNSHISGTGVSCEDCPPKFQRSDPDFLCSLNTGSTTNCGGAICPYGDHASILPSCPAGFSTASGNCIWNTFTCNAGSGEICVDGLGPIQCEDGLYADGSECKPCEAGSSCTNGIKTACSGTTYCSKEYCTQCETCPDGADCDSVTGIIEYCNEGEFFNGNICQTCTANRVCDPVNGQSTFCTSSAVYHDGDSPIDSCQDCPAGYACGSGNKNLCPTDEHAELGSGVCQPWNDIILTSKPCPVGMYPVRDSSKCEPCPAGFQCSTNSFAITACTAYVQYSPYGDSSCSSCPTDHVCPINGLPYRCRFGQSIDNNRCVDDASTIVYPDCPAGWECDTVNGVIDLVRPCEPGTYSDNGACRDCDNGNYCPYPEMAEQLPCQYGYYSPDTKMIECFPCPAGSRCASKTTAITCSDGEYSLAMTEECINCPAGFYCPNKENKQIIPCPPGTFSNAGATACTSCTAGNYCHHGVQVSCSTGYYSLGEAVICKPCPPGFACVANSITKCADGEYSDPLRYSSCQDCPAGYYCPANAQFGEAYIMLCPLGFYCEAGVTFPTECPAGTYGYSEGLTAQSECTACPAGYFCPEGTPGFPNDEHICPLGHFCADSSAQPAQCSAGTYGDQFGLTDQSECRPCKQGRECAAGSTTPGQPCPVGKFCPADPGGARGAVGILCPPGTYNRGTGAADVDKCVPCPAGHYCCDAVQPATWEPATAVGAFVTCNGGVSVPTECRVGSYQSRIGQFTCDLCPTGKRCAATGLTAPTDECEYGTFCMIGTGANGTPCPKGTFSDHTNNTSIDDCSVCPAGYYCDHDSGNTWMLGTDRVPIQCTPGHYCMEGTPARDTYTCPKGTDGTDLIMAKASINCTICAAGFYCPEATGDGIIPLTCPEGHFCPEGTGGADDNDTDIPECPAGTYLDETGKSRVEDCKTCDAGSFCDQGSAGPTGCAAGTYSADDGISSQADCERCPAGFKCENVGTTIPAVCGQGFYSDFGAADCEECDKGHYCNLNTTTYTSMKFYNICPEGTMCNTTGVDHIPDLKDDPCPIGYWCPKGDVKAYQAEPQECPPGTYGQRTGLTNKYECDKCPAGYYCESSRISCANLLYAQTDCEGVQICPRGHYCEEGSSTPTECGPGFYRSITSTQAAVNQTSCSLCRSGYYCDEYGMHDDPSAPGDSKFIKSCDVGHYCPPGSILPEPCDVGSYGPDTNYRSSFECIPCEPGTFCPERGMSSTGASCVAGYYCTKGAKSKNPRDGITGDICPKGAFCLAGEPEPSICSSGKSTLFEGAEEESDCKDCYPGYYCPGSTGDDSLATALARRPCESGQYCAAAVSEGQDCPDGHYCPQVDLDDGSKIGAQHPWPCEPGTFSSETKRAQCEACTAGTFCPLSGMTGGLTCPVGYYCPEGAKEPTACPRGQYNDRTASTADTDCKNCEIGEYCDSAGLASGTPCPDGYNCFEQGIVNPLLAEDCTNSPCTNVYACSEGQYCVNGIPTDCPASTYNPRKHGRAESDCLECTPGMACTVPGLDAPDEICSEKFYCTGGAARPSGSGSGAIQVCQSGHYCPEGSPDQVPCDRGTYSENSPASECPTCTDGYYCPGNVESNTDANRLICPQGEYCGSGLYEGIRCPIGKYSSSDGKTVVDDCIDCEAGKYCPEMGAITVSDTNVCDAGYICKGGSNTPNPYQASDAPNELCPVGYYCEAGATVEIACPNGTFGSVAGLMVEDDCSDCPGGYYCDGEGLTWSDISENNLLRDASKCEVGYYCGSGCTTPTPTSNRFCATTGGICPKGYRCPAGSTGPIPCENGFESPEQSEICSPCAPGRECEKGKNVACPRGYYCEGGSEPIPCPPGTYNNQREQVDVNACVLCSAGFYCPQPGMSSGTRFSCHAGFYCLEGSSVAKPADPGTIGGPCPIGQYCPEQSRSPTDCLKGHYCDREGTTDVQMESNVCAAGYFCDTGSTSATPTDVNGDFVFCTAGHYCEQGAEEEKPCDEGTFGPTTVVGLRSQNECINCPKGKVCKGDGKSEPDDCPQGFYCECEPTDDPTECIPRSCNPGYYCPSGSKSQLPCPYGTYQSEPEKSTCSTCRAGKYCPIDTTSTPIGTITPQECSVGYYCPEASGFEIPCPPGTYNDETGMKVASCKSCPEGYYCPDPGLGTIPDDSLKCSPGYNCIGGAIYPDQSDGILGERCPLGYFCPDGIKEPCAEGSYGKSEGLTDQADCDACPRGFDCSHTRTNVIINLLDHKCEEGYICPAGTGSTGIEKEPCLTEGKYCPEGMFEEQDCPAGTWTDAGTGAEDRHATCDPCPEGSACTGSAKVPCPAGRYCPSGRSDKTAIGCPAGQYSPKDSVDDIDATGLSSLTQCLSCPSGKYCPFATTWSMLEAGLDCYDGYNCELESVSPSPVELCPAGHYCPAGVKTACDLGTYLPTEGSRSIDDCIPCPGGYFCDTLGMGSSPKDHGVQYKCKAGYFCFSGAFEYEPSDDTNDPMMYGICPAGYMCPDDGMAEPIGCPDGQYQGEVGQTECNDFCPAGYLCTGAKTTYDNNDECPPGYYCENDGTTQVTIKPCRKGTYRPGTLNSPADGEDDCEPCPPGKFCPWGGLSRDMSDPSITDLLCDGGYYCANENDGSWTERPYCNDDLESTLFCSGTFFGDICPIGSACDVGATEATPCPANRFCPYPGIDTTTVDNAEFFCASGYSCVGGARTSSPNDRYNEDEEDFGNICDEGMFCTSGQSEQPCIDGLYNPQTGIGDDTECRNCPPGRICREGRIDDDCAAGTYCHGPGDTQACDIGHKCDQATIIQVPCNKGLYQDLSGQSDCKPCEDTMYCDGVTGIADPVYIDTPVPCEDGYQCPLNSERPFDEPCAPGTVGTGNNADPCESCPAGRYCPNYGMRSIDMDNEAFHCSAGYFCDVGSISPFGETSAVPDRNECDTGHYCPSGSNVQIECDIGFFRSETRGGNPEDNPCQPCPGGYTCTTEGLTIPAPCPDGSWCPPPNYCATTTAAPACPGGYIDGASISCTQYHYCNDRTVYPIPCPHGEYLEDGVTGQTECLECPTTGGICTDGQYTDDCIQGHYCFDGTPFPCPAGTFTTSTDLTAIDQCDDCPEGQYCEESGTINPVNCAAGFVCLTNSLTPVPDATKDTTRANEVRGYRCPPGAFCISGVTEASVSLCSEGTYRTLEQGESESDCFLCPTGKYCEEGEGQEGTGNCDDGFFCAFGATSAAPLAITDTTDGFFGPCDEGHYCEDSIRLKCPAGKYQSNPLQTGCDDCDAGNYCPDATIEPIECPSGAYCPTRRERPEYCNIGSYMDNANVPSESQADCEQCEEGSYCPTIGMTNDDMLTCDPGYYCPEGSTSKRQRKCEAGYYCPTSGGTEPVPCDAGSSCTRDGLVTPNEGCFSGYYCPQGSTSPTQELCTEGHFCDVDSSEPSPCIEGTFQPFKGQWTDAACQPCLPGYYCSQSGMSVSPVDLDLSCREGFYCPPGSTSPQSFICPSGYECAEQSAHPVTCPDGTYADEEGSSECEPCPAGFYCLTDKNNGTGTINPIVCPIGFYCVDSTIRPEPCPRGSIGSDEGSQDESDCEICDPGYFCAGYGLTEPTAKCFAGYYCPDDRDFTEATNGKLIECPENFYCPQGSEEPTECPDGTYRPLTHLGVDEGSCQKCDPGNYCETGENPKTCSSGFICLWGALQSDPDDGITGYECPPGHYCPEGALAPEPCPAGKYADSRGASSEGECDECEQGFYCPRGTSDTTRYPCLEGFYCPTRSSVGNPFQCPQGFFCPAGAAEQEPCNPGTFSDIVGATVCTQCPAGFFCEGTNNNVPHIEICPAGSYCTLGADEPTLCPAGKFNAFQGATSEDECTICPAGYYCTAGTASLYDDIRCIDGYYCPAGTETAFANRCPIDYQCPEGSSKEVECDVGYYSNNQGLSECKDCPAGQHCPRNITLGVSYSTVLTNCGVGTYCPANSARETRCDIGTFNEQENSVSQDACTLCEEGFYCDQIASPDKTECDSGFHCIAGSYTARPGCSDKNAGRGEVCPIGFVCENGLINKCNARQMCSKYGEIAATELLVCPEGYFCPEGTTVELTLIESQLNLTGLINGPTLCNQENTGVYCPSNSSEPTKCPVGEWFTSTGSVDSGISDHTCIPCPDGRACTVTGIYDPDDAVNCSPGYYCRQGNSVSKPDQSVNGGPCRPNHYCEPGAKDEYSCLPGTYQNNQAQSKCNDCRSGKYCPGKPLVDDTVYNNDTNCNGYSCSCIEGHYCESNSVRATPCPVGTYGRDGTTTYNKVENCIACDAGHYCDVEGLVQRDIDNKTCVEGYYCAGGAVSGTPNEIPDLDDNGKWINNGKCPLGHYCAAGSKEPEPCPKGTIGIETGAVTAYPDPLQLEFKKSCLPCPPGLYCPQTNITISQPGENGGPIRCPEKYFCPEGSEFYSLLCSPGHYCPEATPAEVSCSYGYYQSETGHNECYECPIGYFCNSPTGTIFPEICPTGHYCDRNATINPTLCEPGTFNPISEPGNEPISINFCLTCTEGHYCGSSGLSAPINPCDPGYVCVSGAVARDPAADENGNGPCPAGFYCKNDPEDLPTFRPIPCRIGTYNPSTHGKNLEDCLPCPAGMACPEPSTESPVPCSAGKYCPNSEKTISPTGTKCPIDHECPEGTADPIPCRLGHYTRSEEGAEFCEPCDAGFFCMKDENGDIKKETCPPKFYCPAGSALPNKCPPGTYVPPDRYQLQSIDECRACPMGNYCRDGVIIGACMSGFLCYSGADAPNPAYGENLTVELSLDELGNIIYDTYYNDNAYNCSSGDVCAGPCPPGFYCFKNVFSELSDVQPCPENTLRDVYGGMSPDDCKTCPPGVHCKKGDGYKHPCEPGFYCPPWYNDQDQAKVSGNITVQFNDELIFLHPAPGPQPCPIYTYRNETGGISIDDCPFCPPGYYCDVRNISDIEQYPCRPGYYCSGQGLPPRKCPAGRMAPVGYLAESVDDCLQCEPGRYCPDPIGDLVNIDGISCPIGFECPEGNRVPLQCEAGYYCDEEGMGKGKICPPGYHCPEGTRQLTTPLICTFPFYCPAGSSYQQPCALGFRPEDNGSRPNRTNFDEFCTGCSEGTYRSNFNQTECFPCEPGYYCPEETGDYTEYICPEGNACPPGDSAAPYMCPPGTYAFGTGNALCSKCLPNTYSSKIASVSCNNCGTASYASEGAATCTCVSDTRIFQESDSSCICKPRYRFSNDGTQDDSEFDSDGDCVEQLAPRCDRRSSTSQVCIQQCGDDEIFDQNYGLCVPETYQLEPGSCCMSLELHYDSEANSYEIHEIDPETGDSAVIEFDSQNVYGLDTVRNQLGDSFDIHQMTLNDDKIFGIRDLKTLQRFRRQSGTTDSQVENPAICIGIDDAILFDITINQFNRSQSEYPIYQQSSTLNTNLNFDFGDFRILKYYVTKTNLPVQQFIYSFPEEGDYVIQNSQNDDSLSVISVRQQCTDGRAGEDATPVQRISAEALFNNGVTRMEPTLEPNWPLIIGLTSTFAILLILGVLLLLYFDPFGWEVFSTKRFQVRYQELSDPTLPKKLAKSLDANPTGINDLKRFQSSSNELEDFNVKHFVDKLRDQRSYIASQIASSNKLLDEFGNKMSNETKRLGDQISKLSLANIQRSATASSQSLKFMLLYRKF